MVAPVKLRHKLPSYTALRRQAVLKIQGVTQRRVDLFARRHKRPATPPFRDPSCSQIAAAEHVVQAVHQFIAGELWGQSIYEFAQIRRIKYAKAVMVFAHDREDEKLKLRTSQFWTSTVGWGRWINARLTALSIAQV